MHVECILYSYTPIYALPATGDPGRPPVRVLVLPHGLPQGHGAGLSYRDTSTCWLYTGHTHTHLLLTYCTPHAPNTLCPLPSCCVNVYMYIGYIPRPGPSQRTRGAGHAQARSPFLHSQGVYSGHGQVCAILSNVTPYCAHDLTCLWYIYMLCFLPIMVL